MAWLEKRGDSFHLCFRLGEQKFKRSLKTDDQSDAETTLARVERRLKLIENGDLSIPDDADLATFIISDGKLERPVVVRAMNLRELLATYENNLRVGTLESNSIATIKLHLKNLARILSTNLRADRLSFGDLQRYVDIRGLEKGTYSVTASISLDAFKYAAKNWYGNWRDRRIAFSSVSRSAIIRTIAASSKTPCRCNVLRFIRIACGPIVRAIAAQTLETFAVSGQQVPSCVHSLEQRDLLFSRLRRAERDQQGRRRARDATGLRVAISACARLPGGLAGPRRQYKVLDEAA